MKKQLLFGSALLLAVTAYSQTTRTKAKPSGTINMAQKLASKFSINPNESDAPRKLNIAPSTEVSTSNEVGKDASIATLPTNISWKLIAGSMNVYGQLVSQTRPLQYNDNLNAVSLIHRKSDTYGGSPASNSGVIVAEVSTNWGSTWDSTCVWSDAANTGRYPQGGIYNPVGNTTLANAHIVACGPVVNSSAFTGNFYGSKSLAAFTTSANTASNGMQFLSFGLASYPANQGPHGWSRYGFTSTDDGVVRSLALIQDDNTTLGFMRGAAVVKGSFNAGVFNWTTDSIIPACVLQTTGEKQIFTAPQMAWNESGTIGYVVFIGAAATGTASNRGWQPIVFKTTNSGATWAPISGIDFNNAAFTPIKNKIASVNTNSALEVPFFNVSEGFDAVVDANGKLHISSTIVGTSSTHQDSLAYTYSFTTSINPSDNYQWTHTPGDRPYLYDFIGDGTGAWTYKVIDSLSTEGPSSSPSGSGFAENPWDNTGTGGSKIGVDARIQLGRTPDGKYITYSWSESDTNSTNGAKKWNNLPNIKTRLMDVTTGSVSTTEINVSKVATGQGTNNANVANRATLHYMSPTTGAAVTSTSVASYTIDVKTPFTVTNSNPYSQLTNNTTWYSLNTLAYAFTGSITIGFMDNGSISAINSVIYPNPAKDNATLSIDVKDNSPVTIAIYNLVGALVKTQTVNATVGANNITIDLSNLTTGMYIANVKVGNAVSTKKLIIE